MNFHWVAANSSRKGNLSTFGALQSPATNSLPSHKRYKRTISTAHYVHWQDQGVWLGCFEESPDYLTHEESLDELKENLRDLYRDLTSGAIRGIRRVAELTVG
jgi:hypothetical protein